MGTSRRRASRAGDKGKSKKVWGHEDKQGKSSRFRVRGTSRGCARRCKVLCEVLRVAATEVGQAPAPTPSLPITHNKLEGRRPSAAAAMLTTSGSPHLDHLSLSDSVSPPTDQDTCPSKVLSGTTPPPPFFPPPFLHAVEFRCPSQGRRLPVPGPACVPSLASVALTPSAPPKLGRKGKRISVGWGEWALQRSLLMSWKPAAKE